MKRNRREVIELSSEDESAIDQPAARSATKAPVSVPSPEVAELRKKVAKLEKDFQGACRYARRFELRLEESQKRVHFLEEIIDKKPPKPDVPDKKQVEDLQKRLTDISAQLDETRKETASREAELLERVYALNQQLAAGRAESADERKRDRERLIYLSQQLEAEKAKASEERIKYHDSIHELHVHNETQQKQRSEEGARDRTRIAELTMALALANKERSKYYESMLELRAQNDTLLLQRCEEGGRDRAKIEELTVALAHCKTLSQQQLQTEPAPQPPPSPQSPVPVLQSPAPLLPAPRRLADLQPLQQLLQAVQQQQQLPKTPTQSGTAKKVITVESPSQTKAQADDNCKNIFRLVPPDTLGSIGYGKAVDELCARFSANYEGWNERYEEAVRDERLYCDVCQLPVTGRYILIHLFSPIHAQMLRANAVWTEPTVSLVALWYWQHKLSAIQYPPAPPPAPPAPPPATFVTEPSEDSVIVLD